MLNKQIELNKIYLGDAYELIKQLPDKSVDMVYTDIPYLHVKGGVPKGGKIAHNAKRIKQQLKNIVDGIDYSIFTEFIRVCKKANIFIWCSRLQLPEILNFFAPYGYLYNLLVWTKNNPIPACNQRYLEDVEYCLHFRESGVKLNDGYDLKSKWYNSAINKSDKDLFNHPTIKPLPFVERHILHASQEGDIILDPFIGSGTTAIAAAKHGRQYIGFEREAKWYEIACNRLNGIDAKGQMGFCLR